MNVIPRRFAPPVLPCLLGLGAGAVYARNDAPGKTAGLPATPKSDQLQPFAEPLILAELLVLGPAINPGTGSRRKFVLPLSCPARSAGTAIIQSFGT
jgi:hypothetical protein